ncbi:uncharacterized protein TNIN_210811 [Trichonephila inaurata madagascariensis]|uniref:Uncharacterized protein n=1 Tax=Trichonephila inaurata madagascariensis TaxID=2747483 RepID=A0A8X6WUU1_9ARAC|nr:uncharacterized protein TNIN_210811 [Trichonephila inaurata madagascariensis]
MLDASLYVDYLYYGAATIEDAYRLSTDAIKIFLDAGMDRRKLRSNYSELNSLWIEKGYNVGLTKGAKFLAMVWTLEIDDIKLKDSLSSTEVTNAEN